jgi:hypothetical protein
MNTKKFARMLSPVIRALAGLSLAVVLTFVAVPGGVTAVRTPHLLHPANLIDPPTVD